MTRRARLGRRARRLQRGLTVYVVVLVIAMLSAVGVFAAKSASLALAQGGYVRQATQTHYVNDYAMNATLTAVNTDVPGYIQQFEEFDTATGTSDTDWQTCVTPIVADATRDNARCYKFGRAGLEDRFTGPTANLLEASGASVGQLGTTPGSLGRSSAVGNFIVEATDLAQLMVPMAGERAGSAPVAYYAVTFTSLASVGPPTGAAAGSGADLLQRTMMTVETSRVQATLGPVPAR